MTAPPEALDDAERLEEALRAMPTDSGLCDDDEEEFRRLRRRIGQRQADWRRSMGSLGPLFDDEAHRAKALAGNLATELSQILEVWTRLRIRRPPAARELQPLLAWLEDLSARWQLEGRRYLAVEGWDGQAAEVFDGFLEEICARAISRAAERLQSAEPVRNRDARRWQLPGRLISAIVDAVARVFHPRPRSR